MLPPFMFAGCAFFGLTTFLHCPPSLEPLRKRWRSCKTGRYARGPLTTQHVGIAIDVIEHVTALARANGALTSVEGLHVAILLPTNESLGSERDPTPNTKTIFRLKRKPFISTSWNRISLRPPTLPLLKTAAPLNRSLLALRALLAPAVYRETRATHNPCLWDLNQRKERAQRRSKSTLYSRSAAFNFLSHPLAGTNPCKIIRNPPSVVALAEETEETVACAGHQKAAAA